MIKIKQEEEELGTKILIDASEVKVQEPVTTSRGTSISVKNLFYNVPARRNFLKSNPVEFKHIIDEFQRVALANPSVAFAMFQDDLETFSLDAGKLSKRIVQLYGKNYQQQLIPCAEDTPHIKISGYVGKARVFQKNPRRTVFLYQSSVY